MKRPIYCSEEEIGFHRRKSQSIMDAQDDEECGDQDELIFSTGSGAKKRRLSSEQVRALEKIFEVDEKLEPEMKLKLAQDLQLQPRQISVWFQNRRARWKTKQLERDYADLKSNYDALLVDFDSLKSDNQSLLSEIKQLKAKLDEDNNNNSSSFIAFSAKKGDDKFFEEVPCLMMNKDGTSTGSDENISSVNFDAIAYMSSVENYDGIVGFGSDYYESFMSSVELNSSEVEGFSDDYNFMPLMKVEESDEFVSSEEEAFNYWD